MVGGYYADNVTNIGRADVNNSIGASKRRLGILPSYFVRGL
ncbi:hypothetical protein [Psychrobacter sp. HD31]